MARTGCCGGQQPAGEDDAVLLAALDVPLVSTGAGWRVSDDPDAPVTIDRRRRPVLLSLRMVQELITQNSTVEAGDAVAAADAFGLLPAAGTGEEYSRVDHSHGTPELPPLSGDLEGLLGESASPPQPPRVVGLRGQQLANVEPADGDALVFEADRWAPGTVVRSLPGLSGDLSGTLGGSGRSTPRVSGLQGRAVAATMPGGGQALVFDGTQWAPGAVTATVPDLSGDLGGTLGGSGGGTPRVSGLQGRAVAATMPGGGQALVFDGTQWAPGAVTATVPDLSGDLSGTLGGSGGSTPRVSGLQGSAVARTPPGDGQALVFDGREWTPTSISAPAGNFVGRGREPFEIVAAGDIILDLTRGATVTAKPSYGGLRGIGARPSGDIQRMLIDLGATVTDAESLPNYVVKLTPILPDDAVPPFRLFLRELVSFPGADQIEFTVLLLGDARVVDSGLTFRFQVEVSRFRSN